MTFSHFPFFAFFTFDPGTQRAPGGWERRPPQRERSVGSADNFRQRQFSGTQMSSVIVLFIRVAALTSKFPGSTFQNMRWFASLPSSKRRSIDGRSDEQVLKTRCDNEFHSLGRKIRRNVFGVIDAGQFALVIWQRPHNQCGVSSQHVSKGLQAAIQRSLSDNQVVTAYFRLNRHQQRGNKHVRQTISDRDPLICDMPDTFGMCAVAVRYQRYSLEIAAPAATRVAGQLAIFARLGRSRFHAIGIWLRAVKIERYRDVDRAVQINTVPNVVYLRFSRSSTVLIPVFCGQP